MSSATCTWSTRVRVRGRPDSPNPTWGAVYRTRYTYDVLSRLTNVQDQAGNQTTLTYDAFGRKAQLGDPVGGVAHRGHRQQQIEIPADIHDAAPTLHGQAAATDFRSPILLAQARQPVLSIRPCRARDDL